MAREGSIPITRQPSQTAKARENCPVPAPTSSSGPSSTPASHGSTASRSGSIASSDIPRAAW